MDLLDRMLKHDAWTTARLLAFAHRLPGDALDRPFDLGHHTVRATFIHLITNMCVWTDLMSGLNPLGTSIPVNASTDSLIEYHNAVAGRLYRIGREVVDHGRLDDTFVDVLDRPPRRKSFGAGLLHLATHSMHHRAQLLHMLRRLGVEDLPEGDAVGWENQHLGGWQPA